MSFKLEHRQTNNQKLVDILQKLVNENPTLRFSQILQAFDFVVKYDVTGDFWTNEFYSEPSVILARVTKALEERK